MKNIIKQVLSEKGRKILTGVSTTFALASFFIVALTFNFIGNGTTSSNLIIGFTFGFIAFAGLIALAFISYKYLKDFSQKMQLVILLLEIILILLAFLSFIFGSMGYLDYN